MSPRKKRRDGFRPSALAPRPTERVDTTTWRLPTIAALVSALAVGTFARRADAVVPMGPVVKEDGGVVDDADPRGDAGQGDARFEDDLDAPPPYVDAAYCPPQLGGVDVPVQPVRGTGCGCGGGDRNESAASLLAGATLIAAALHRRRRA